MMKPPEQLVSVGSDRKAGFPEKTKTVEMTRGKEMLRMGRKERSGGKKKRRKREKH